MEKHMLFNCKFADGSNTDILENLVSVTVFDSHLIMQFIYGSDTGTGDESYFTFGGRKIKLEDPTAEQALERYRFLLETDLNTDLIIEYVDRRGNLVKTDTYFNPVFIEMSDTFCEYANKNLFLNIMIYNVSFDRKETIKIDC